MWNVIEYDDMEDINPMSRSANNTNATGFITHIVPNLKPFTQYAMYIKTYTIQSERKGAQSDIIYFKTKPTSKLSVVFRVYLNLSLCSAFATTKLVRPGNESQ